MTRYKLKNLPKDLETYYKTELCDIDRNLTDYEKGTFKRLATGEHSIDMICVVLEYQKNHLEHLIKDIDNLKSRLSPWRGKYNETNDGTD
jgi:hypothetical protein